MTVARLPDRNRWQERPPSDDTRNPDLARCASALERIARILDDFARAYLNARFTGKGTDRWSRG